MDVKEESQRIAPLYAVVRNSEGQYSVWWAHKELPPGWFATGFVSARTDCLRHISEIWTDMRPISFRKATATE